MLCRYKKARALGRENFERALQEDQELLDGFGMGLLSVNSGVRVVLKKSLRGGKINPWDVIEMSPRLWGWLRPLLVELAQRRVSDAASGANGVNGVGGRPR